MGARRSARDRWKWIGEADNWQSPNGPEDYGLSADDDREGEADTEPAIIEPLETIDPADWDGQKPPERRWIIRNMIPLGEAGLLNGHGGAGKTLLGCQIAVGVNMHTDCLGFAVEHGGPVLLYSAEERQEELHRRLAVILESRGRRLGDLKGFRIYCPPPTETMLTTVGRDGLVRPTMTMLRLEKTIETLRPVLVTIDHVSIAFGGTEIDRSIAGQNVGFMKRLAGICGSAVLGFQHVSFAGLNSDEGSGINPVAQCRPRPHVASRSEGRRNFRASRACHQKTKLREGRPKAPATLAAARPVCPCRDAIAR
jgi:hypothetical protein